MKFFITDFSLACVPDGTLEALLEPLDLATSVSQADAIILPLVWRHDFDLNDELLDSVIGHKKPVVVLDYLEHHNIQNCILMGNTFHEHTMGTHYRLMHEMLREADVRLYFKRELPVADWPEHVKPCDFPHGLPDIEPVSEADYHARAVDLFMAWGYSHVCRPKLHGALMQQIDRFAWNYAFAPEDVAHLKRLGLEHNGQHICALFFLPWWRRQPLNTLLDIQGESKISLSLYGNGHKCFRSAEAGYNSVMFHMGVDTVLWSYPWTDGENCVNLPVFPGSEELELGTAIEVIYKWLRVQQGSLYPVYLAGVENNKRYRRDRYLNDYLLPLIEAYV